MLAVGCLIPFVMLAVGAVLGSYLADVHGGYWGAGIGFCAGSAADRPIADGDAARNDRCQRGVEILRLME
jgi:hypothetical protein